MRCSTYLHRCSLTPFLSTVNRRAVRGVPIHPPRRHMALERGLEGRDYLLKLVQVRAVEIQKRHRAGLQLGTPYTSHGSCLLLLYRDVRGTSYQKESGIHSNILVQWHGFQPYVSGFVPLSMAELSL